MRVAPLGVSYKGLKQELLDKEGAEIAAITHSHSFTVLVDKVVVAFFGLAIWLEKCKVNSDHGKRLDFLLVWSIVYVIEIENFKFFYRYWLVEVEALHSFTVYSNKKIGPFFSFHAFSNIFIF